MQANMKTFDMGRNHSDRAHGSIFLLWL